MFSREAANERRLQPNVVSISPRVEAVYSELRSLLIHLDANGGVHEDEDASGCQLEPINAGLRDAREENPPLTLTHSCLWWPAAARLKGANIKMLTWTQA